MKYVGSNRIEGELRAPPSKSMTLRAVAAGLLVRGRTRIANPSDCDDARAAVRVARALGARVERAGGDMLVTGDGEPTGEALDCGESGLCLRMFSAIAALYDRDLTLTGTGSLETRPVDMVVGPLRSLGVYCKAGGGRPPIAVRGPLSGGRVRLDGSGSSQFLTGLLMTLPLCERDSEVLVDGLRSAPYVRMTIQLLASFGVRLEHEDDLSRFHIPGGQEYRNDVTFEVEGDWSGAAALLVAGALSGPVTVTGLRADSLQADRAIIDALRLSGARVDLQPGGTTVERNRPCAFEFDATDCPDLFPPLVALAASCEGQSVLAGAGRLRHKESDRAAALCREFGRMGADVRLDGDRLIVNGGQLVEAEVDSHGDHRIAMACAVGAIGAGASVRIADPGCVTKSYPGFFEDLASLGAKII